MMRRSTPGFLFGLLALAASGGLLTAGCGNTESQVGAVHPVTGAPCASPGARAPASDGCNECTCESGTWACTEMACTASCAPGAMKAADDGCNTCSCTTTGDWACTDLACTQCTAGEVRQSACNTCTCMLGTWACTMKQCGAECSPGETRLGDLRTDGQCRVCTCTSGGDWSCAFSACECSEGDTITAADGCNACACDDTLHWGACTEEGCGDRCPLPQYEVDCDANPVYAKNGPNGPCCRYECPADAPPGWPQYATLEACGGTCPAGFINCDGDTSNGCEVDPATSVTHCGACYNACAPDNGTPVCIAGACSISTCNPGFQDCNGDAADGCEVASESDPTNCGSCGLLCALPNAATACTDGVCSLELCDPGFANCNGDLLDGCEIDTRLDESHCGACAVECEHFNATPVCTNGMCMFQSCDAGFANCDALIANGCETNIAEDENNCGQCAQVCVGAGATCVDAVCVTD